MGLYDDCWNAIIGNGGYLWGLRIMGIVSCIGRSRILISFFEVLRFM